MIFYDTFTWDFLLCLCRTIKSVSIHIYCMRMVKTRKVCLLSEAVGLFKDNAAAPLVTHLTEGGRDDFVHVKFFSEKLA